MTWELHRNDPRQPHHLPPLPPARFVHRRGRRTAPGRREQRPRLAVLLAERPGPRPARRACGQGVRRHVADDPADSSALRTAIVAWKCNSSDAAQSWSFSGGELRHGSTCLNDKASGGSGSPSSCTPAPAPRDELWTHNSHGEYVLKAHGGMLCLDDPGVLTGNGTRSSSTPARRAPTSAGACRSGRRTELSSLILICRPRSCAARPGRSGRRPSCAGMRACPVAWGRAARQGWAAR